LFDYFRVPYERTDAVRREPEVGTHVDGALGRVWPADDGSSMLLWARRPQEAGAGIAGAFKLDSTSIFARVLRDEETENLLSALAGRWQRSTPICDLAGNRVASVWEEAGGSTFLPFDPNEVIERYWTESYLHVRDHGWRRALHSIATRSYYRARPFVPTSVRTRGRRLFSRTQSKQQFPDWPIESSLHDFYRMLFTRLSHLSQQAIPMISLWPGGCSWALILTHDVETAGGYDKIELLCDIETAAGYRSSWNFVPMNHDAAQDGLLEELRSKGFEVGVHGLYHDGRDIAELDTRLPEIRRHAERWGASGFRSPSTLRSWDEMPRLLFDYDSSYFDTSPYEPQPGGCCTWLPYMNENLVELPITLPQDHTLFEVLEVADAEVWLEKARFLKRQSGMALVLTHPDYCGNERLVTAYQALLDEFADDSTAWKPLPRDASEWWRKRANSELRRRDDGWEIVGPAAEAGTVQIVATDAEVVPV
jgi:hypothetical protein